MKHAGPATLDALEDLLERIRRFEGLKEKKRGTFYGKASALLHFHEDPAGLFADLRAGSDWRRVPVNTPAERKTLLRHVERVVRSERK